MSDDAVDSGYGVYADVVEKEFTRLGDRTEERLIEIKTETDEIAELVAQLVDYITPEGATGKTLKEDLSERVALLANAISQISEKVENVSAHLLSQEASTQDALTALTGQISESAKQTSLKLSELASSSQLAEVEVEVGKVLQHIDALVRFSIPEDVGTLEGLLGKHSSATIEGVSARLAELVNSAQLLLNRMTLMLENSSALFMELATEAGGQAYELAAVYQSMDSNIAVMRNCVNDMIRISDELPVTGATLEVVANLMGQIAATTSGVENLNRAIESARLSNIAAAANGVCDTVLRTADLVLTHRKPAGSGAKKKGVIE